MFEGIAMGVGSTVGAMILVTLVALLARQWRTPKRVDRLEQMVPPMARALLALLHFHGGEEMNADVEEAERELNKVLTDGSVSQKARK